MSATLLIGELKILTTFFMKHFEQQINIPLLGPTFLIPFCRPFPLYVRYVYHRMCCTKCKHEPLSILYKFSDKGFFILSVILKQSIKKP